jgi:hypothetical protein
MRLKDRGSALTLVVADPPLPGLVTGADALAGGASALPGSRMSRRITHAVATTTTAIRSVT